MSNNRKVCKFRLSDNKEEHGIKLVDFTAQTVQKMLIHKYIDKIEFPITNIASYRSRIIDFSKLVTYSMLYIEFDTTIFSAITKTDLVIQWNRKNAKNPIDFKTEVNKKLTWAFINKNSELFIRIKRELIFAAVHEEKIHKKRTKKELDLLTKIAEKYLSHINPLVWFFCITYHGSEEIQQFLRYLRITLNSYLEKSVVAEYFSFMLIEVLMSINQMSSGGDPIFALWKFRKEMPHPDDRGKLHVILSNSKSKFETVRQSIHYRAGLSVKEKNLESFYTSESGPTGESQLGLYYLSFLEDACRSMDLKFESFVNTDANRRQTLINLILSF